MNSASEKVDADGESMKRWLIPILTMTIVIAITAGIYLVYGQHPERLTELKNYVYLGAFLVSVLGNATIILPGAVLGILTAIGVAIYQDTGPIGPIMVGLAGGGGAAIGEITGYLAGFSGRGIIGKVKIYDRLVAWVGKWGAVAIFFFSLVPLVFDLAGIVAGALRVPLWKFLLACWLGRTILYLGIILGASWGLKTALPYFG